MKSNLVVALLLLFFSISLSAKNQGDVSKAKDEYRKIYLLRHAEKMPNGSKDPGLTEAGQNRALWIYKRLISEDITIIYSTNYQRTLATVQPLAMQLGISITLYNPSELASFATLLKSKSGNAVVVGHSNTTPSLNLLLGGKDYGAMDDTEYNRLYLLKFKQAKVTSELLKIYPH